jgi:predicted Zn-dependent protease
MGLAPQMGQVPQQIAQVPAQGQTAVPYMGSQNPPFNSIAQAPPATAPYMAPAAPVQTSPPLGASAPAPPIPPLQDPAQSASPITPPKRAGLTPADRANADISNIVSSIPQKPGAGDYLANVSKFTGGTVARWTNFPVLIHLPMGSPANWHKTLEEAVGSWGKFIPVRVAQPSETADVEIAWINHLPPRALGQTNLEVFNGRMRVTVYLLRPSYYLPGTSDRILRRIAEHEVGHALGIFGHSGDSHDLMFSIENVNPKDATKYDGITPRDLNTLRKIYESSPLPPGFQSPQPMGWSIKTKRSN